MSFFRNFDYYSHFDFTFQLQTCSYCKLKGANISCCQRLCRKSFHLPCLLENNGLVKFCEKFDSFCHIHHGIERSSIHSKNETCLLCSKVMKEYNSVTSVEMGCCGSKWYTKMDHFECGLSLLVIFVFVT